MRPMADNSEEWDESSRYVHAFTRFSHSSNSVSFCESESVVAFCRSLNFFLSVSLSIHCGQALFAPRISTSPMMNNLVLIGNYCEAIGLNKFTVHQLRSL